RGDLQRRRARVSVARGSDVRRHARRLRLRDGSPCQRQLPARGERGHVDRRRRILPGRVQPDLRFRREVAMISRSLWIALAACSGSPPGRAGFANVRAVTVVAARPDVPKPPKERQFWPDTYHYDGVFHRRFVRAMDVPRPRRALGVNALDQVPDSTWFTNRI